MTRPHPWASGILIVGALLCAGSAPALDPGPKCQSAKNKDAGKYAACRQKAEAGLVKTGDATKYAEAIAKCDAKFFDKEAGIKAYALEASPLTTLFMLPDEEPAP